MSDHELEAISRKVNNAGKAEELADSMEICLSPKGIYTSLRRWLVDMKKINIPTRSYLIRYLRQASSRGHQQNKPRLSTHGSIQESIGRPPHKGMKIKVKLVASTYN